MQLWSLGVSDGGKQQRLETEERVAVWVQMQSAGKPGRANVANEVWRESVGEFPFAQEGQPFVQAINSLDEAPPYNGGPSVILKV